MDIFQLNNKNYLCIVDYHSKFLVIKRMEELSAENLIATIKIIVKNHYTLLPSTISKLLGGEDLNQIRTIKEALNIRVNDPSLNRNVGKYHLPHVWDEVLVNTSELKLK